ncbi:MAG: class I SAM-dependent methyltransferase [Gaiellaceae bacterium]
MDFTAFVLHELPQSPARVLEIGCGDAGGVVPALLAAGYDALGVDPRAPDGPAFRRDDFRTVGGEFDAVVAGRVLHHVRPLDVAVTKLASLAPLLLVDEFAWDRIDAAAQDWYESQHRLLAAAGAAPPGPPSLEEWRTRHPDLHRHDALLAALRSRYDERVLEWLPYLHRWLGGPSSEALESALTGAGAFAPIGWRWAGLRR